MCALLIEDSERDADLFMRTARRAARYLFDTTWVRSLAEATAELSRRQYDVVFLDLDLEDASGTDGLERLAPLIDETPIIVLSGLDDEEAASAVLRSGAHDYLSKAQLTTALVERTTRHAFERAAWRRERLDHEAVLRGVLTSTPDLIVVLDSSSRIEIVSDAWRDSSRANGGAPDGYLGVSYLDVCHASALAGSPGADEMLRVLQAVLDDHRDAAVVEYECARTARVERYRAHVRRMRSGRGRVLISHHDVTELWEHAAALSRSEKNFRALIDHSPSATAVLHRGEILYSNAQLARLFGSDRPEQLKGESLSSLVLHEDRERLETWIWTVVTTDARTPTELRFHSPDGTRILEVEGFCVSFAGRDAVVVHGRDVTQRRELTAQAMHLDRAITTGLLAAGVGHEINNPLTYVVANLELLSELVESTDTQGLSANAHHARALIDEAREGAGRVQRIVADLKRLASSESTEHKAVSIEQALRAALRMVHNQLRHHAQVVTTLDDAPLVFGDETKLIQVFSNLLVNAAHALRGVSAERAEVRVRLYTRGGRVFVEVEDTGAGIPAEHLDRVFEPFFTTKGVDGTGLGLSICRDVVISHGGTITVRSGGGSTCFRAVFPAAPEDSGSLPMVAATTEPNMATQRILVIDDDALVARAARRALESRYELVVAASGAEALDVIAREHFDLILCDLMMPGMGGDEVHRELTTRHPELADRFVFVTGGALSRSEDFALQSSDVPTIHKPFGVASLRDFVAHFLAARLGEPDDDS